ncbi:MULTISPECIES: CidA/LrgA family protein [Rhodobacterales]|jgi:holin-like protein|uniref:CidA/LrgA family protein n=1 Tax=Rhodobacterales TaxID=204455 RepID=UPI00237FD611|nr:CidA/LrgA family protein [Phaeobacter gallaeciensis]MEC9310447.1 CidA/LrgA family protein [Pseudomonadota bacterium]MDE4099754.1 CidA/LrgA family protein [Phaeobacter gallaeciensis]MDE4108511.1 CidA/LrgA family protein [Phaeobacter gallaeciensis]MDE4110473.1 CidA/LrgA family protein [Phaeobacter gallaeciensis]MDE4117395.1 CidA/LrgA family protein [Phaeobacter gallaeciensis]
MLGFLTLILVCQLAGEFITGALALPIPGPVLGMVFLFIILMLLGRVPAQLDQTANGLLRSMSLLFVPAGTGVILHFQLLGQALLPLGLALVVSTLATIAVTGLLMQWLGAGSADG